MPWRAGVKAPASIEGYNRNLKGLLLCARGKIKSTWTPFYKCSSAVTLGAGNGISKERSDGTAIAAKQAQTCSVAGRRSRHVISAISLSEQESPLPANGFCGVPEAAKSKSPSHGATGFKAGAENGIWTHGTLARYTRFPVVLLRQLRHLCKKP